MASPKALWYLKQTHLFDGLSDDELAKLSRLVREKELKRREPAYLPGRPGSTVYVLKAGRIKLFRLTPEGRPLQDVATRPARLLLRLGEEHGTVSPRGIHLRLGLTHEDLASLIATTRETLSKYMSEFRARRLIDYDSKQILLLNLPGLREQAKYPH